MATWRRSCPFSVDLITRRYEGACLGEFILPNGMEHPRRAGTVLLVERY
jgi:hypothetical protein